MVATVRDNVSQYLNLETKRADREGSKSVLETEGFERTPISVTNRNLRRCPELSRPSGIICVTELLLNGSLNKSRSFS